ncbi:alpha/beta-Hydrolases superfamily protein [Rhynchospora pubera]|uniref:Alpha/beta-Hydrolases superfamily protein n=1 Tax=Rhynchospora pubera TaxID=906938 RepID=A0AAV8CF20_9POAL|nr:alpha/beta-Hydrolases superfamily protein [Rhynchospora pubera]
MGNVTASVAARFAFFPPDPASYEVVRRGGSDGEAAGIRIVSGIGGGRGERDAEVHVISTRSGTKVATAFLRHPGAKLTLLYSHGNAADLGQMLELLSELRSHLKLNVMCYCYFICSYDYSGYGASTGKPTEHNTYHDIEAVYDCLKKQYDIRQEDIILYGQSVGSGPTLHLASRLKNLRGVVLHSPILSGIRVLYPIKVTLPFDIFKNIDRIKQVKCPVLVMHGTADEIVDFSHGKRLYELAKEKYDPLWVTGGGHCNLETFPEYIKHLRKFISDMEKLQAERSAYANASSINETEVKHNKCLRFGKR